eukprot:10941799-Alexandrium_andersonii.AAC.1
MDYAVPGTTVAVACRFSFADEDSPVWTIDGRPDARFPLRTLARGEPAPQLHFLPTLSEVKSEAEGSDSDVRSLTDAGDPP